MPRRALSYGGLVAFVLVLLAVFFGEGFWRPPAKEVGSQGAAEEQPKLDPSSSPPMRESGLLTLPKPGFLRVIVKAEGVGVPRCSVSSYVPLDAMSRQSTAVEKSLLGLTNDVGFVDILLAEAVGRSLFLSAKGFASTDISVPSDYNGSQIEATLVRGHFIRFTCRAPDGSAVAGVRVRASASPLPRWRAVTDDLMPIGPWRIATHSGVSDVNGDVEVGPMPVGRVYVQVHHDGYLLVGSVPQVVPFFDITSDGAVQLKLAPLYGAFATVVDDEVLSWSARYPPEARIDPSHVDRIEDLKWSCQQVAPGAICMIGICGGDESKVPSSVSIEVFGVHSGYSRLDVPFRRVTIGSKPDTLSLGRRDASSAVVSLLLETPSGKRLEAHDALALEPLGVDHGHRLRIPLSGKVSLRLPLGRYRVVAVRPLLQDLMEGQVVSVERDGDLVLPIKFEASPCVLTFKYQSGILVDGGELMFVGQDKQRFQHVATAGLSGSLFILPIGSVGCEIVGANGEFLSADIVVKESSSAQHILVGTLAPRM